MGEIRKKADESIDKVLNKIDVDDFFSKKKKTKPGKQTEQTDPEETGARINDNQTVEQSGIEQNSESNGISSPKEKSGKFVTLFQDVMMGDQRNTKFGPFFVPSSGQCVDIETANEMQGDVARYFLADMAGH